MRKIFQGAVIQNNLDKTVVVTVVSIKPQPKYLKRIRLTKKYFVHDEHNTCKLGDTIIFIEVRPMSKFKKWVLLIN